MNHKFMFLALISASAYADREVTPTFVARSQSLDGARKLVGVTDKVHQYDIGCYWNFSIMPEYTQSFNNNKIALSLFGDDLVNCNQIRIQGSGVSDRNSKAWLADYFYLPPDYDSYFSVNPTIQNVLVDLDLYIGLDDAVRGLYLRFHGPINWTKWNLKFEEPCDVVTTGSYSAGYFAAEAIPNNQLLQSFGEYAAGGHPLNRPAPTFVNPSTDSDSNAAIFFTGLNYARMQKCAQTRTGFADLRGELGWNFLQCDDYHLGLNFQIAAPTGNKREAAFAFDAVVGNGNHWEVGGGLTAHYAFWHSQSEDKHAGFYIDASITHINKALEQRTFDLCGKPNSRYMLAQSMGALPFDPNFSTLRPILTAAETSSAENTTGTSPKAVFAGTYTPVANLTTLKVKVSSNVQVDLAVALNYTSNNWAFDLGYDFWYRSCERISQPQLCDQCGPTLCSANDVWALKGDARVFGFVAEAIPGLSASDPVRLSATECGATIHSGTNAGASTEECAGVGPTLQNCGVDSAQFAYGDNTRLIYFPSTSSIDNIAANHIKTSLEPKFINCCDINLQETKSLSNKVFAHLGYTWNDHRCIPYLGVGGFAEFGSNQGCNDSCDSSPTFECGTCDNTSCQPACCSPCIKTSLSQWGVWLKGGLTYN